MILSLPIALIMYSTAASSLSLKHPANEKIKRRSLTVSTVSLKETEFKRLCEEKVSPIHISSGTRKASGGSWHSCKLKTIAINTRDVNWKGMDVRLERRNISAKVDSVLLPNSKFNLTICDGSCRFASILRRSAMNSTAASIMSRVSSKAARKLHVYYSPSCVPIAINNREPVEVKLHVEAIILRITAHDRKTFKSVRVRDYGIVKSLYNVDACTCA